MACLVLFACLNACGSYGRCVLRENLACLGTVVGWNRYNGMILVTGSVMGCTDSAWAATSEEGSCRKSQKNGGRDG